MSISSRLWLRCYDAALASATAPFLVSLSRGSLPKSSFRAYIAQDAFYLISFKQAFASAATICRKDSDGFGVNHFETLEVLIEDELKMHAKFALDLEIDLAAVSPLPQTLLYTDFLGAASKSNYISHICAAMTPCMTLYGWLGRRAEIAGLSHPSNPYSRWIDEYSSKDFAANAERLEMLLDHYAEKDGQKFDDLVSFYAKAMELEYSFFCAHETSNWTGLSPKVLGIDFDDTISVGDTISNLCLAGLKAQKRTEDKTYENLFKKYITDQGDFMAANLIESSAPPKNYLASELKQFLQTYSKFEDSMLTPVESAGILAGISSDSLASIGKEILVKPDAISTLKYARQNFPKMESHILSVNWSKKFIGSIMDHNWPGSRMPIHANELVGFSDMDGKVGEGELVSTGMIDRKLTGPEQKGELFRKLIVENSLSSGSPSIYIGDSLGDLSALLEADIGVIIGTSKSLRRVCTAYGVQLKSLDTIVFKDKSVIASDSTTQPILYFAESWAHIGFCLFGKRYVTSWMKKFSSEFDSSISLTSTSPRVLSVAGSDSGGGAGIQADIKTCCAHDVFATTAITCLTAQNTKGVTAVSPTSTSDLRDQLDAVLSDIGTDSLKTGMIPSAHLAMETARAITKYAVTNVVVDPVMVSTSGSLLMDPSQARDIIRALFPVATLVTPNIPEAAAILKMIGEDSIASHIESVEGMEQAAKAIYALGPAYVLVKGGHLAPSNSTGVMVDVLYDGQEFTHITGPLVQTENVHGTGCTLSTAIACELAKGLTVLQAIRSARSYLTNTLKLSASSSIGKGTHGPLLHMAPFHANRMMHKTDSSEETVPRKLNPVDLTLYAVTDSSLNEKLGHTMEYAVAAAVAGGATIVQVREKNITTAAFVDLARRLLLITKKAGVPLIINDRVDVAMAIGADGVHVGQSDMNAAEVRKLIGPHKILGVSTKSCQEAMKAQEDGADYVGTGAVYPTNTKVVTRELGVDGLKEVTSTPGLVIPVVAIGGIAGEERIKACLQDGGAQGIAVVSAIFGERDVQGATATLRALVAKAVPPTSK